MAALSTVLWERLDGFGTELCRLETTGAGYRLSGVLLSRDHGRPVEIRYDVTADGGWRTLGARVAVDGPRDSTEVTIDADGAGAWRLDGHPVALEQPCLDLDLSFTPATNTLALRRLNPEAGQRLPTRALLVSVPSFRARAAEQSYERIDATTYRYVSRYANRRLVVDANGLVLDYELGWRKLAHSLHASV